VASRGGCLRLQPSQPGEIVGEVGQADLDRARVMPTVRTMSSSAVGCGRKCVLGPPPTSIVAAEPT